MRGQAGQQGRNGCNECDGRTLLQFAKNIQSFGDQVLVRAEAVVGQYLDIRKHRDAGVAGTEKTDLCGQRFGFASGCGQYQGRARMPFTKPGYCQRDRARATAPADGRVPGLLRS